METAMATPTTIKQQSETVAKVTAGGGGNGGGDIDGNRDGNCDNNNNQTTIN